MYECSTTIFNIFPIENSNSDESFMRSTCIYLLKPRVSHLPFFNLRLTSLKLNAIIRIFLTCLGFFERWSMLYRFPIFTYYQNKTQRVKRIFNAKIFAASATSRSWVPRNKRCSSHAIIFRYRYRMLITFWIHFFINYWPPSCCLHAI